MAGSAESAGRSLKRKSPSVQAGALGVTTLERDHEMNSTANTIDRNIRPLGAQIIPFRSATLLLVDNAGEPFVPMKPVVVGMGLDWKSQHVKLQGGRFKSVMAMITTTGADGKTYEMACLPLRKLPGWLMSIHASKVRPDLRENVLAFQGECDDVLWSYWNEGKATRNDDRSIETVLGSTIGTNGFNMLGVLIRGKVVNLPAHTQRKAVSKIWSQTHAAFGVRSAADIPAGQLDAARNFIAAYAIEGEWLPPVRQGVELDEHAASNLRALCHHADWLLRNWNATLEPALRQVQSPLAARFHDHFVSAAALGRSLAGTQKLAG